MKKTLITLATCLLTLSVALPVFAQVNTSVSASVTGAPVSGSLNVRAGARFSSTTRRMMIGSTTRMNMSSTTRAQAVATREAAAKTRSDNEIDARITNLTQLQTRVNAMVKVSSDDKSSLSTTIQTEITNLTNLKAQIDADTGTTTLKTDMQSITQAYRIYALVIPQGQIAAAADRIGTITANFTTIGTKLETRISALPAGTDTSAMTSSLADFTAKLADANVQAQAAVTETATLQPDNGDATILASNTAALKDARTKIQAAQKDLQGAQQDAQTIVNAIKQITPSATVTASSTTSTQ